MFIYTYSFSRLSSYAACSQFKRQKEFLKAKKKIRSRIYQASGRKQPASIYGNKKRKRAEGGKKRKMRSREQTTSPFAKKGFTNFGVFPGMTESSTVFIV